MDTTQELQKNDIVRDPLIGYDIGWDYARYGFGSNDFADADGMFKSVLDGYNQGMKQFPKPAVQFSQADFRFVSKWLHIRMNAYRRGRICSQTLTWQYFKEIDSPHCIITREPFSYGDRKDTDWTIDRINNDAAYAPGNIVCMSKRANKAKGRMGPTDCMLASNKAKDREDGIYHGLSEVQWIRLACLTAMNSLDSSLETGYLPMAVRPPRNIVSANPLHILQSWAVSLFSRHESHEQNKIWLRAFKVLGVHNIQKRANSFAETARMAFYTARRTEKRTEFAIGDAWMTQIVGMRWLELAEKLTFSQASAVIDEYQRLSKKQFKLEESSNITDSWGTETRGYISSEMLDSHAGVSASPAYA